MVSEGVLNKLILKTLNLTSFNVLMIYHLQSQIHLYVKFPNETVIVTATGSYPC